MSLVNEKDRAFKKVLQAKSPEELQNVLDSLDKEAFQFVIKDLLLQQQSIIIKNQLRQK